MKINENTFYIGIDVGSVSIKICLISHQKNSSVIQQVSEANPILFKTEFNTSIFEDTPVSLLVSKYQRTQGEPLQAALNLLSYFVEKLSTKSEIKISATGAGGKLVARVLNVHYQNEFQAIAAGSGALHPEVRTILEMGGDSSKYILLEHDSESHATGILDYEVNGDCAAGTGSFIDQQASRLLYKVEDVGDIVMKANKPASIAGRCSVFAKSDMIHAQQKGFQPPEILKGLCQAVVRNFKGTIIKGKEIIPPVAFIGGVAANKGIVSAIQDILELEKGSLIIPGFYAWMEAIGTALSADTAKNFKTVEDFQQILSKLIQPSANFDTMAPINKQSLVLLKDKIHKPEFLSSNGKIDVYLGIDIGSVSTKLALIDEQGNVIKGIYTKTQARPIEVVGKGLKEIEKEFGSLVNIKGVATTGSGRELIGELVGADTIKDEITAHKTGATFISKIHTDQTVDTIFDIGGQDSKFISIEEGVVVDFTMNEACAAGTGSFLEEQAEKLGINIKEEFAELAFQSESPIRLGERCTVFMEKEITPFLQRGARKKDIVAGLAYSIVSNYLNRVVRGRKIGDVVYFQGGTAYNEAVAAAFATVLKKQIIVPPFNGILGAIGAALLAKEKAAGKNPGTSFRGYNLENIDYKLRAFTCKACTNFCDIQEFNVEGKKTYWGDKCSEQYRKEVKLERKPVIPDLIKLRENLLLEHFSGTKFDAPTIGIPKSLYYFDQFPFWSAYFKETGCNVVLSDETNRQVINDGVETRVAESCFPVTVAHGHISDLIRKDADYFFVPNLVDAESKDKHTNSFFCPWGQTLCFVLNATPSFIPFKDKILAPNIRYRQGKEEVKKHFFTMAKQLGISRKNNDRAIERAYEASEDFTKKLKQLGKEAVETILDKNEKAIIFLGRPYNLYDKLVNLNIPSKLRQQYGINVIPLDFLEVDNIGIKDLNDNMYWSYGQKIIKTARWTSQFENFHLIYITNFKCGPDSYIKHYIKEAAQKPYLIIQFDEHGNDAGIITRCEAYLDSKGFL